MITGDLPSDDVTDEPAGRGGSARNDDRSETDTTSPAADTEDQFSEDDAEDQDEFEEEAGDEVSPDIDEFDDVDDGAEDIDAVVELSSKEQNARSLEVRRAIEARIEKKKLDEDIDYLDLDFDD